MEPILELLYENSIYSIEDMASMLGMDKEEVEAKIAQYKEDGILLGGHAIIDHDKLD